MNKAPQNTVKDKNSKTSTKPVKKVTKKLIQLESTFLQINTNMKIIIDPFFFILKTHLSLFAFYIFFNFILYTCTFLKSNFLKEICDPFNL